jgi:exo-1,4-beta-D-glucosaminidase
MHHRRSSASPLPLSYWRCIALCGLIFLALPALIHPEKYSSFSGWSATLSGGWQIHTSDGIAAPPETISTISFSPRDWCPANIPSTGLAALVGNHVYPDPYFGMNLRMLPGMGYPIGGNFSNLATPRTSPFRLPWWFRTTFSLPPGLTGKTIWLEFNGINYRADIWLNGRRIAQSSSTAGTFRRYEFDVTDAASVGPSNALAILVYPPTARDLALTWVDWNPSPPDKDMGLYASVILRASGPVAIRAPQVVTHFGSPALDVARLTVRTMLRNASAVPLTGVLSGNIGAIQFQQRVSLSAREEKTVLFSPEEFPQLNVAHPLPWWPYRLGDPHLETLHLTFQIANEISDEQDSQFGISEITSELTPQGHRLFRVNGRRILIRGAGWTPDMMLRRSTERMEAQMRYVREMNLNTLRLEGKPESDAFFDLADRYGILVMAGWSCCDHWERWSTWAGKDRAIAAASLADQATRLRNHPSVLAWLDGSDRSPPSDVERLYLKALQQTNWTKPILSSATEYDTSVTGATGVKMTGPYDYVPPNYWMAATRNGGAFGFNTETSPGPAIPPVESLRRMLPANHLWPVDNFWNFHAGGSHVSTLRNFNHAMDKRYAPAGSLDDYVWKAQAMAYEGERAMFEAYSRNRYRSTGVIQWMLNNAWPSMIWHLFDYYLRPAAGYFATRKACEPLHALYSYDDSSVWVTNDYQREFDKLKLTVRILGFDGNEVFSRSISVNSPADSSQRVFTIPNALPDSAKLTPVYFLRLELDASAEDHPVGGEQIPSVNFYWLSTKPDVLDFSRTTPYYTPESSFADFTELSRLPPVHLRASCSYEVHGAEGMAHVRVKNPSAQIAFLNRLQVLAGAQGEEILPVYWNDNYIALLPGEVRELTARFPVSQPPTAQKPHGGASIAPVPAPALAIDGWNVPREIFPLIKIPR